MQETISALAACAAGTIPANNPTIDEASRPIIASDMDGRNAMRIPSVPSARLQNCQCGSSAWIVAHPTVFYFAKSLRQIAACPPAYDERSTGTMNEQNFRFLADQCFWFTCESAPYIVGDQARRTSSCF